MGDPISLSYTEIRNWRDLTEYDVSPFDVHVLKQLDTLSLNSKKN